MHWSVNSVRASILCLGCCFFLHSTASAKPELALNIGSQIHLYLISELQFRLSQPEICALAREKEGWNEKEEQAKCWAVLIELYSVNLLFRSRKCEHMSRMVFSLYCKVIFVSSHQPLHWSKPREEAESGSPEMNYLRPRGCLSAKTLGVQETSEEKATSTQPRERLGLTETPEGMNLGLSLCLFYQTDWMWAYKDMVRPRKHIVMSILGSIFIGMSTTWFLSFSKFSVFIWKTIIIIIIVIKRRSLPHMDADRIKFEIPFIMLCTAFDIY